MPMFSIHNYRGLCAGGRVIIVRWKYDLQKVYITSYGCSATCNWKLTGLRISNHYGNFHKRSPTDLDFGIFDADKAISVELEHTGTLDPRGYAHIQCALLYTTVSGKRRVRVCNLAMVIVQLAQNVFQYADMEALVCHLAREGGFWYSSAGYLIRETGHQPCLNWHHRRCLPSVRTWQKNALLSFLGTVINVQLGHVQLRFDFASNYVGRHKLNVWV